MTAAISVENLTKSYGDHAVLKGVSFEVERGEIFALLGVNGAGKTTTLECIEGLKSRDGGKIQLNGAAGIQLQSSSLPAHIKCAEAVRMFALWNGGRASKQYISALGIDKLAKKQYGALSEGQKPPQICEEYSGSIKKVYKANGVPLCAGVITHFISAFIHLLIVCVIIFAVAPVAFGASLPQNTAAYFGLLALYIAVSLSVGCVFGLFGKSPSSLAMYAQIVFLPSILLSGIMFPADMLPDFLRYIGYIFPATAAYGAMTSFAAWQLPVLFCELAAMVALCALRLKFLAKN